MPKSTKPRTAAHRRPKPISPERIWVVPSKNGATGLWAIAEGICWAKVEFVRADVMARALESATESSIRNSDAFSEMMVSLRRVLDEWDGEPEDVAHVSSALDGAQAELDEIQGDDNEDNH